MKKLFGCVCVCRVFLPVLLVLCTIAGVNANNIRVEGKTRVVSVTSDTAVLEVTLRWDNSWRDDFNWDAAWVFFKFKKRGLDNPWQHVYLSSSGHVLSASSGNEGGGYSYMVGTNGGKVNGLYVMRDGISEGNVRVRLRAKWPLTGSGLTSSDFGDALNGIYVAVHAIEMVYIPYGAYYLGDAHSYKSFAVGDTAAVVIDSENALTLSAKNGMPNVSLAASYPKGYAGFYVMKYETSQEQYVEFLNSLTLEQQKARVANNNFSTMKRGDYVFGDLKNPSCRNGIVYVEQRKPNTPVVFGNNLNPSNDLFSTDDGQTLACNYMSVEDMIAYCSWSGLRPMSELEYEKACRRFYPQVPDKGEYAWNTNDGINSLSGLGDLAYLGDEREQANNIGKNVNGGTTNSINGPVRCGLFATSATNQTQAGATYWGVMEMSGNLKELCMSVRKPGFDGHIGTGVYDAACWSTAVGSYGVRGGGFSSPDSLLRTSDRTEAMNYFASITQRDSTVGFRGVYGLSGIKIDGGEIQGDTVCSGGEKKILNVQDAFCLDFPNMRFQYSWYVKKPGEAIYELIENQNNESLLYEMENTTSSAVTYYFRRTGVCAMGIAESETSVYVFPSPWTESVETYVNVYPSFVVNSTWTGMPQTHWKLENAPTGISITIDRGVVSGLDKNPVFLADVTVSSDKCPGQEWTKTLKVIRQFNYTGAEQSITLAAGKYKMECWGGAGCQSNGGYTSGEIYFSNATTLFMYVGQATLSSYAYANATSFNGGTGSAGGWPGGGASDIRLIQSGNWKNFGSLKSRIMVAGGGGSGSRPGAGGGLIGNSGGGTTGGSQTTYGSRQSTGYLSAGFGYGGGGCGGGGGYYGGGASACASGAGGGSSFISGHNGCNAIDVSSMSGNIIHTGQPIHYSGLYFTNTVMIDGSGYQWTTAKGAYVGMPNLTGTGTMTGNAGHGQVKITPVN